MRGGQSYRIMLATDVELWPEHTPTYTLDKQVAAARKEMGEERWQELKREHDEYEALANAAWKRFMQHGDRHRYRNELKQIGSSHD